jgi:hypothetical protein
MLGEANSPLLDEIQVSNTKQGRESQGGGAPLRVLVRIDDVANDVECGDKLRVMW